MSIRTTITELEAYRLKNGSLRYRTVVQHEGLNKVQEIKGEDPNIVWQKGLAKAAHFDEQWRKRLETEKKKRERAAAAREKQQKKDLAVELTRQAEMAWDELDEILSATLGVDDAVDWNELKDRSRFPEAKPTPPDQVPAIAPPRQPQIDDPDFVDSPTLWTKILDLFMPARKVARLEALQQDFEQSTANWVEAREKAEERTREARLRQAELTRKWELRREDFLSNQRAVNQAIDEDRAKYEAKVPSAVEDYCDLVLENSAYPDFMPNSWELQYIPDSKIVAIDFALPDIELLPRLKSVSYVQSRDEFNEKNHTDAAVNKKYDSLAYQVALRTIHEIFEADRHVRAVEGVVFNGEVNRLDPATGHEVTSCIISMQVTRDEFDTINLAAVDPKACFKKLKGVGSAKLHSITPVAPLMRLDTDDARFVDSYAVASTLDDGENLASMDWEDFEHLVREVFELEFGTGGAEVKVTRASKDGGIDAIAFDPDPIRGGKIVIQAKRYTRTVGLAAVRDLYGTVMNEGANKGILVSTASYGPDAYAFVRDKPLTLLGGGELLHLLQRHGYKARINLKEARDAR